MNLKLKLSVDYYVGGTVHALLKPFILLLRATLHRDHSLDNLREITVLKMLGGGSLVIAYPSLLALKQSRPGVRLNLVTTPAIKPFAETLGLFDEIILLRDNRPEHLALDSVRAIARLWFTGALIDLEIHSRLSSIFVLMTCARNRIGIYTDVSYWRTSLYTHLLFYNKYAPVHAMYDQIARLFGAPEGDYRQAKALFRPRVPHDPAVRVAEGKVNIGIAPGCSDLGKERMLPVSHWVRVLSNRCSLQPNIALYFIGGPRDGIVSGEIMAGLRGKHPGIEIHNCCGSYSLLESIDLISQLHTLYCIDSGLIHFARLLEIKTVSFWGPTDPASRLRPDTDLAEETHYVRLTCSPCVHIVAEAPCYGRNICMDAAGELENYKGDRNPIWPAQ